MSNNFSNMFTMKYFRAYPYWLQLVLLLLLEFTMLSFSSAIFMLISKFTGVTLADIQKLGENSSPQVINGMVLFQLITSVGIFLLPSLLYAYLATPKPDAYLGFRKPGKPIHWLLVVFIFIGIIPVFVWIENMTSHINFSAQIKADQAQNDRLTAIFTTMPNFGAFIKTLFIMAIVPAIGEELFFRGLLLRFAKKKSPTIVFPIIFSALVFTFAHANYYGFLSIFIAGILLGYIYYLTGSLWCCMLGHFINNGLQIILLYLGNNNATIKNAMSANSFPPYIVIGGAVIFAVSFYFLLKTKTPLQPNWTDDFATDAAVKA